MQPQSPQDDKSLIERLSKELANTAANSVYHSLFPLLKNSLLKFRQDQLQETRQQKQVIESLQKENRHLHDEINKLNEKLHGEEGRASRLMKEISQIKRDGNATPSLEILRIADDLTLFRGHDFEDVTTDLTKYIMKNASPQPDQKKFRETKNRIKSSLAKKLFAEESIDNPDIIINAICLSLNISPQLEISLTVREKLQKLIDASDILKARIKETNPRGKLVIDPENILFDSKRHEVLSGYEESGVIISVVFPAYQPANEPWVRAVVITGESQSVASSTKTSLSLAEKPLSAHNQEQASFSSTNEISIIPETEIQVTSPIPVKEVELNIRSTDSDQSATSSPETTSPLDNTNHPVATDLKSSSVLNNIEQDTDTSHPELTASSTNYEKPLSTISTNQENTDTTPTQPLVTTDSQSVTANQSQDPSNALSVNKDTSTIPIDSISDKPPDSQT